MLVGFGWSAQELQRGIHTDMGSPSARVSVNPEIRDRVRYSMLQDDETNTNSMITQKLQRRCGLLRYKRLLRCSQ